MEYAECYNYKGFFSILLLALVDYDHKFLFADVGTKGLTVLKRLFNYCTSRKLTVTENAFQIWLNRFRVFKTTMKLHPDKQQS